MHIWAIVTERPPYVGGRLEVLAYKSLRTKRAKITEMRNECMRELIYE